MTPAPVDEPDDWWRAFYDDLFADVVLEGDRRDAEGDADALVEALGVRPGARVFDQCCGVGRLAVPLARRGLAVVGVDQSEGYVARARARAAAADVAARCEFVAADACAYAPPAPCDAAFNWYTSFGHAADDARNEAMLARAYDALRPGGRFALDYANVPRLLARFQPCLAERRRTRDGGDVLVVRESTLDLAAGLLVQRWTFAPSGARPREARGATRLYMPHELAAMLRRAGFVDVAAQGERGAALTPDSARCVVRGARP